MTEEIPATTPSNEQSPREAVVNPQFITWKHPPYCELCNVHFSGEPCSKTHFEGQNHKNKLRLWRREQAPELTATTNSKSYLCRVCWKEMNTQAILDTHNESPAHKKEVKGQATVKKLKEEYRQLKELHETN